MTDTDRIVSAMIIGPQGLVTNIDVKSRTRWWFDLERAEPGSIMIAKYDDEMMEITIPFKQDLPRTKWRFKTIQMTKLQKAKLAELVTQGAI